MECIAKHAPYQVPDEEWICPKCGADMESGEFIIEESDETSNPDCEKLHKADALHCSKCGYDTSGGRFSTMCMKKANMIQCPHCKGAGVVKN